MWKRGNDDINSVISCFVSIGCGRGDIPKIEDSFWGLISRSLVSIATQTDRTAEAFQKAHGEMFNENRCFRFNVDQGLEQIGLEEWKKMNDIRNATDKYLRRGNTGNLMESAKHKLAQKSREGILDNA